MPLPISDALKTQKNKLEQDTPWIYFIDIELDNDWAHLVNNVVEAVVFNGHTYQPYPFAVGPIKASSSGEVQTAQVSIGNAEQFFSDYLTNNVGLIGKVGKIWRANKFKLDDPTYSVIPNKFKIVTSSETEEIVVFNLSLGVDLYGIEGPIGDYDLETFPHLPYGPQRISLGVI